MTEARTETEEPQFDPDRGGLDGFVGRQCARLWRGYQTDQSSAVSELARLRRSLPRRGVISPESWETFSRGFPPDLSWDRDEPTRAELAAAAALALYAVHQQSRRATPMHVRDRQHALGASALRLQSRVDSQGVERRMQALARSNSVDPILEHLRALVTQLRAEGIPLDYARLALDLSAVQQPSGLRGVRTRWLRDFYRPRPDPTTVAEGTGDTTEETA